MAATKRFFAFLLATVVCVFAVPQASAYADEPYIDVNTKGISQSSAIDTVSGQLYYKTYASGSWWKDVWNKVTLDADGYILISGTPKYSVDYTIYDVNSSKLSEGKFLRDSNKPVYYGLEAGTYYVKFSMGSYSTNSWLYGIHIFEGVACEVEPNDTFSKATPITVDQQYLGFCPGPDYYSVSLNAGSTYKLIVENYEEIGKPALYLYESDRNSSTMVSYYIKYDDSLDAYVYEFECEETGTYYLYTKPGTSGDSFTYVIQIQEVPKQEIPDPALTRYSGTTRFDTMSAIVKAGFGTQSDTIIVASGKNFPDALSASALAGVYDAPIVLTDSKTLSPQAEKYVRNKNVIIIGGTGAVSSDVEAEIESLGSSVTRISGANRYETSRNIYEAMSFFETDTCIIASGNGFADALSISPYAYSSGIPIFLANKTLDQESVNAIKSGGFENVIIVGGAAAISNEVKSQLGSSFSYTRLSGSDRYETSSKIAAWAVERGALTYENLGFATGKNFPDALAGGAFCGSKGSVLLLVDSDNFYCVNQNVAFASGTIFQAYIFGGAGAVSEWVESVIYDAL